MVRVLARGFVLQVTKGRITVITRSAGCDLGVIPDDAVEGLGGPTGSSAFASSTAFKVLPSGRRLEIPVNAWRARLKTTSRLRQ